MDDSNNQHISDFATLAADPEIAALLDFEPAPRKIDVPGGWSADKQREVIARLCVHGSPNRACDEMGMHRTGLTKLYKSPRAKSFRAAWDGAVALAAKRREEQAKAQFVPPGASPPALDWRLRAPSPGPSGHLLPQRGEGPALPVICDKCRTEGAAGDEAFSAIPDILAFDPVPRSAHDKLWPAETQRAFIAALAVSGSPVRAARTVGRHAFGAEKLRKGRGARSFNEAWEAALDLARERELIRLHGTLTELGEKIEAQGEFRDEEDDGEAERRGAEARANIFAKLQRMRFNMIRDEILPDPEKRAAWVVLHGAEEIEAVALDVRGTSEQEPGEGESGRG